MSKVEQLLEATKSYASGFSHGKLPMPPARNVAVLTCMDARIDPLPALGAVLGDLHVIRNAGGRATADAIRSLVISQQLLGTDEILVLRDDVQTLRNSPLISNDVPVYGAIYDVNTGRIEQIT